MVAPKPRCTCNKELEISFKDKYYRHTCMVREFAGCRYLRHWSDASVMKHYPNEPSYVGSSTQVT